MHVLVVEDDVMLSSAIRAGLAQQGWTADAVGDAVSGQLALVEHQFQAILLDLQLCGTSGLDLLGWLRKRRDVTPVVIITARDALTDRVRGLDSGADDYVVKPFELPELFARLRAVVRRAQGRSSSELRVGDVAIEPEAKQVTLAGAPIDLSIHEYRTLLALMERQGRVVAREQLEEAVYGNSGSVRSNTIAVYVHQLRRKLGEHFIVTVPGFGYRVEAP